MAKIGDYIHYDYRHYGEYGLNVNKESQESGLKALQDIHDQIINNFKTLGNSERAGILEEQLNAFYGKPTEYIKNGNGFNAEEIDLIKSGIEAGLSDLLDTLTLKPTENLLDLTYQNWFDETARSTKLHTGMSKTGKLSEVRISPKKFAESMRVIKKLIQNTQEAYKDVLVNGYFDQSTATVLQKQYNAIKTLYDELYKSVSSASGSILEDKILKMGNHLGLSTKSGNYLKNEGIIGNWVDAYNGLRQLMATNLAVTKGQLGEYGVAAILQAVDQKAKGETVDCLKLLTASPENKQKQVGNITMTGNVATQKALLSTNFAVGTGKNSLFADEWVQDLNKAINSSEKTMQYTTEDGDVISAAATQDKVDLIYHINEDGLEQDLNLSIKNYDLTIHKEITLHSGNLLRLMQDYGAFINHYLNIVVSRQKDGKQVSKAEADNSTIQEAHKIFNHALGAKSLIGGMRTKGGGTTKMVEYLIINGKTASGTRFQVYPAGVLAKETQLDDFNIKQNGRRPSELQNIWIPREDKNRSNISQAYSRIRQLVLQLAKMSFSAHIKTSALKGIEKS